jgi:hypothetical protein
MECLCVIRVGQENIESYHRETVQCPECMDYPSWSITQSLAWSNGGFGRQIEYFELAWASWLKSDEGKIAQEKAKYNL